ncbi:MAG: bifunctional methylenetetrahydrofolate dehydrogenase/methenyltetrahydrofolate cyclohydrolase FolD [Myxococcota bacterium]
MVQLIDGKAVAARVRAEVAERAARLSEQGVSPTLAVLLVGEHEPSKIYVRHKQRAAAKVGITSQLHTLPAEATQQQIIAAVQALNDDPEVHGILVQLPLPEGIHTDPVIQAVRPEKDVDGFHSVNMGKIATARPELTPCTPKGVMRLLREYDVNLRGAHAVVVGRSRVVGRPMSALLLAADATVTTCHRHTVDTASYTRRADVLVVAAGSPALVRGDWVKEGAVVIDVGISRLANGRLQGDVAFDEVAERARLVTPVPGGVGPMTIAMLLENTCILAERHALAPRDEITSIQG